MALRRRKLTIYHIRGVIDGSPVSQFEQVLADPGSVDSIPLDGDHPFDAQLYLSTSEPRVPPWVPFLNEGFGDLGIVATQRPSAVLVIKTHYYKDHYFALTFGQGRHLLRQDAYDRNYGLRVALNVIYQEGTQDTDQGRLRSISATTVAANTIRTRRQSDRKATFEAFGVDIQRDLLGAITGTPIDSAFWGTRISGSDGLSVVPSIEFDSLGQFLRAVAKKHRDTSYQQDFNWIDNLRVVQDPDLLDQLYAELINVLLAGTGDVEVAVPGMIDWDDVEEFRYSFDSEHGFADPADCPISEALERNDLIDAVDISHLRRWQLEARDDADEVVGKWPLMQCLSGELTIDGENKYVLADGEYFEISRDYGDDLDGFIDGIAESNYPLLQTQGNISEGEYNERAAASSPSFLLLDKKTVRVLGKTTPIEICDILSDDGAFIHVKRKLGSSALSHLFAQGSVSADLFLMSAAYRDSCLTRIREAERERAEEEGDDGFAGRFATFEQRGINTDDYTIVYAIVANWNGQDAVSALPFFSKVNLRRHVEDLRRMGYAVQIARIEV
jgi:uncharacterized protein (TIGR04141 family)